MVSFPKRQDNFTQRSRRCQAHLTCFSKRPSFPIRLLIQTSARSLIGFPYVFDTASLLSSCRAHDRRCVVCWLCAQPWARRAGCGCAAGSGTVSGAGAYRRGAQGTEPGPWGGAGGGVAGWEAAGLDPVWQGRRGDSRGSVGRSGEEQADHGGEGRRALPRGRSPVGAGCADAGLLFRLRQPRRADGFICGAGGWQRGAAADRAEGLCGSAGVFSGWDESGLPLCGRRHATCRGAGGHEAVVGRDWRGRG